VNKKPSPAAATSEKKPTGGKEQQSTIEVLNPGYEKNNGQPSRVKEDELPEVDLRVSFAYHILSYYFTIGDRN
jgi:hypothetical protein